MNAWPSSHRDGGRRERLLLPILAVPALLGARPGGCDVMIREVRVEQPVAFGHGAHLTYLRSGQHREEMIGMHLEALELEPEDAPAEMWGCSLCHSVEENRQCLDCHELLLDRELRAREDVRTCVTCHRGAWSGSAATLPGIEVCSACHGESAELILPAEHTPSPEEDRLLDYLRREEDVPWIQLHTTPDHVYFSHVAHVRHAEMACERCHEDVSALTAPPTRVVVFSMDGCVRCHEQEGASVDCLICHQ